MEPRYITQDDIWMKARILSEGARMLDNPGTKPTLRSFKLDRSGISVMVHSNDYSRLEIRFDSGQVTILDAGDIVATGVVGSSKSGKLNRKVMPELLAVPVHYRCYNQDAGKGCLFCEKNARVGQVPSGEVLSSAIVKSTDAIIDAIEHGWRGCLMMTGGVLPPWRRDRIIDRFALVMERLQAKVDTTVLAEIQITVNVYPPDDLFELQHWRGLGISATSFDLEVMDPAFWRAICPGKAETTTHEQWIEASAAAAEVFGRGRGSMAAVVLGIEPMDTFLRGFENLVTRGVYPVPYCFMPPQGKQGLRGFRPPVADWLVEVSEKMADILFDRADTFDVNLLADERPGMTRTGNSFGQILLWDEMFRRLQSKEQIGC